jgi:hypothetical protein
MDVCWKKPISRIPLGSNPPIEGCYPNRFGFPPKNNVVKKCFPLVGGVESYVLDCGSIMVGTTKDTDGNVDVWVVEMFE